MAVNTRKGLRKPTRMYRLKASKTIGASLRSQEKFGGLFYFLSGRASESAQREGISTHGAYRKRKTSLIFTHFYPSLKEVVRATALQEVLA
jgi:hypothetical protein